MIVGEQPGDQEDLAGRPFVGPAGQVLTQPDGARVVATVHPSYLLRLPDEAARIAERRRFVEDLKRVRALL